MILTGRKIKSEVMRGNIIIDPFDAFAINPNSYNYRIGTTLKVFSHFSEGRAHFNEVLIPDDGMVLKPHQMYLGNTLEKIGSKKYAMSLIGRSSLGRYGLFLQLSANLGHTTAAHQWTLELVAAQPMIIYPRMVIGQVSFWVNKGKVKRYSGLYGQHSLPQESLHYEQPKL